MQLSDKQFDEASQLANEIIDFAFDGDNDAGSALACLMAAVPYLIDADHSTGDACRILKILMNAYGDKDGTAQH